ncbi:MAG TPA: hypothetical protein VFQ15_09375 [Jiangellaceae bacterium]|nr:hypothetical protein [Jiangellaceae bacterium]
MNKTLITLGGFAGAIAVAFGAAFALGSAAEPISTPTESDHSASSETDHEEGQVSIAEGHGGHDATAPTAVLPGLAVSEAGYTLVPVATTLPAGDATDFRFSVTDPEGGPVHAYTEEHEKELHLIAVRRDLSGFQHVHPTRDAEGTWSVPLDLSVGGTWRVFADFTPAELGRGLTLGTDVTVAGEFVPLPLPAASTTATTDGYDVTLEGTPTAGSESELTFTVSKDGTQVTDLEPYLGAFGHLVSLRTGDLAYLHTHPAAEAHAGQRGGPDVEFGTEFPTAGTYRLFLDFQHGGAVHTAEFTVTVP